MNEMSDFAREFRLSPRQAAALFGVSARSWRRWRRRGSAPRSARHLIEVCRAQAAPINFSVPRGPNIGCNIYEFRERLFGVAWRDWRPRDPLSGHRVHRRRGARP